MHSLSFDLYAVTGRSTSHGMNFMKIATLPLSVVHPFTIFFFLFPSYHLLTTTHIAYSFPLAWRRFPYLATILFCYESPFTSCTFVSSILLDSIFLLSWCYLYPILVGGLFPTSYIDIPYRPIPSHKEIRHETLFLLLHLRRFYSNRTRHPSSHLISN